MWVKEVSCRASTTASCLCVRREAIGMATSSLYHQSICFWLLAHSCIVAMHCIKNSPSRSAIILLVVCSK